jgi:hypothetical protein
MIIQLGFFGILQLSVQPFPEVRIPSASARSVKLHGAGPQGTTTTCFRRPTRSVSTQQSARLRPRRCRGAMPMEGGACTDTADRPFSSPSPCRPRFRTLLPCPRPPPLLTPRLTAEAIPEAPPAREHGDVLSPSRVTCFGSVYMDISCFMNIFLL